MNAKNIILLFSALFLFTSCPKSEELIADSVNIEFYNHVNGVPIVFDSITGYSEWFNTLSGQTYNILNLYYLITDIRLTNENGSVLKNLSDIHFVSSDDDNTNYLFIPEILSCGEYSNIEFVFGINSEKNINNAYINENFHNQMFWPDFMGGGYHYMKLEGKFDNETSFYATHTGGLDGTDYSITKSFPINIISTENGSTHNIRIATDVNNWYSNPNNITINSDGIMGNSELQQKIQENGKDVFDVSTY